MTPGKRWLGSIAWGSSLLLLAACDSTPAAPLGGLDGGTRADGSVPALTCLRPARGCPCEPGTEPQTCYPTARTDAEGRRICYRGTRSCRDGEWSGCESIESWLADSSEPGRASAPLLGAPETCSSCDPACNRTSDDPDEGDLGGGNDEGLEYCDPPGGLCLASDVPPPPPPPAGCDVYYELSFGDTATYHLSVTLSSAANEVSAFPEDDGTSGLDERGFVESVVATSCPGCVPGAAGGSCEGCTGGTLELTVIFANRLAIATGVEQQFEFDLVALADWSASPTELDRQHVCLRVPPINSMSCVDQGFACATSSQCCSGVCARVPGRTFSECASSAAVCIGTGGLCTVSADCCTGGCNAGYCDDSFACLDTGDLCSTDSDCCNGNCGGGVCSSRACLAQNAQCTNDGQCCSGNCKSNGKCGSGSVCAVAGETCSRDGDCCSTSCVAGTCQSLTFCRAAGEPCTEDGQCCGLTCAAGYCEIIATECLPRYEPCHQNSECCGLRCDPDDQGVDRCLPLGGCRTSGPTPGSPYGEVCSRDAQCCSGQCRPDPNGDLRCLRRNTSNTGCSIPAGALAGNGEQCNNDCQCASGNCERLAVSTVHSRCMNGGPCVAEGETCSIPEDCCGGACVLWPDDVFRCGVPPDMDTAYTMGSFVREWDGTTECAENERPLWGDFTWSATIHPATRIRFEFQAADSSASLGDAPVASFTDPSETPSIDIGALVAAVGSSPHARHLRMTAVLISEDGTRTPVLHDWSLSWTCTPTE